MPSPRVAVYGGGVGGLTAAHELALRGFRVVVYESTDACGGKARSQWLRGTGTSGRRDLPGEHGFRFYPAFYRHLDATMEQIPVPGGTVKDRLVGSEQIAIASRRGFTVAPRRAGAPSDLWGALALLRVWFGHEAYGLSVTDAFALGESVFRVLATSEVRRQQQMDERSWFDYARADAHSRNYQVFTATMPRTMVAMDGRNGSAYTIGKVGSQLFVLEGVTDVDRVMDGPTDERWLFPWVEHLEALGVRFETGRKLVALDVSDDSPPRVTSARFADGSLAGDADYHVCALPLEDVVGLVTGSLASASPSLRRVRDHLGTAVSWMVGAQYFLRRPVETAFGHLVYPDSEWALTSISQGAFWKRAGRPVSHAYGDGSVHDVLSVDISNWDARSEVTGRSARQHTRGEILREVFRQLQVGLNHPPRSPLEWADVVAAHLDENVRFDANDGPALGNETPLLVHPPGSWKHRPPAELEVDNLTLAADYVATFTNLATMEGANEAAKRAVRAILSRQGRSDAPEIVDLPEPRAFMPLKRFDEWLFRRGRPHPFALDPPELLASVGAAMLAGVVGAGDVAVLFGTTKAMVPAESFPDLERFEAAMRGAVPGG